MICNLMIFLHLKLILTSIIECLNYFKIYNMPDQKRLPYPENTESYLLFASEDSKPKKVVIEDDDILLQTSIINNANGSSYIEYNDAKGFYN